MVFNGNRAGLSAALILALMLPACSSPGEFSPRYLLAGGRDIKAEQETAEKFAPVTVCPKVQVRDGTQMLTTYEKGKDGDPTAIRTMAAIRKFARECKTDASGTTTIEVGVAGRLLSGASGFTGSQTLPLRIVMLRNGDEVLYSKLHPVTATIAPGTASTEWTVIAPDLAVTGDKSNGSFVIYVGFDEGGKG